MNPCPPDYVICAKYHNKPQVLSVDTVKQIINGIECDTFTGLRFKTQVILFYATGMRKSGLLSLSLDAIDLEKAQVRFSGKNSKEAVLPLSSIAMKALKTYLAKLSELGFSGGRLWKSERGRDLTTGTFNSDNRKWRLKLGLEFSSHCFRRSMASHMLANGASPYVLSELLLRHESTATLSRYLGVTTAELTRTHDRLPEIG